MGNSLLQFIKENNVLIGKLAKEIGLTHQGFMKKVKGLNSFKAIEILKISKALNLSIEDVNKLFFKGELNASLHNKI